MSPFPAQIETGGFQIPALKCHLERLLNQKAHGRKLFHLRFWVSRDGVWPENLHFCGGLRWCWGRADGIHTWFLSLIGTAHSLLPYPMFLPGIFFSYQPHNSHLSELTLAHLSFGWSQTDRLFTHRVPSTISLNCGESSIPSLLDWDNECWTCLPCYPVSSDPQTVNDAQRVLHKCLFNEWIAILCRDPPCHVWHGSRNLSTDGIHGHELKLTKLGEHGASTQPLGVENDFPALRLSIP